MPSGTQPAPFTINLSFFAESPYFKMYREIGLIILARLSLLMVVLAYIQAKAFF